MLLKSVSGEAAVNALRFSSLAEMGPQHGVARRADGTVFPIQIPVGRAAGGDNVQFTGFIRDTSREAGTTARLAALHQGRRVVQRKGLSCIGQSRGRSILK